MVEYNSKQGINLTFYILISEEVRRMEIRMWKLSIHMSFL